LSLRIFLMVLAWSRNLVRLCSSSTHLHTTTELAAKVISQISFEKSPPPQKKRKRNSPGFFVACALQQCSIHRIDTSPRIFALFRSSLQKGYCRNLQISVTTLGKIFKLVCMKNKFKQFNMAVFTWSLLPFLVLFLHNYLARWWQH